MEEDERNAPGAVPGRDDDVAFLIEYLHRERGIRGKPPEGRPFDEAFAQFRALVNTREPLPASARFLEVQDRLLRGLIEGAGVACAAALPPAPADARLAVWRGDITTIAADAIVNAANSALLGCWVPGHFCIDNAIHTFAGVQLRLACAELMERQGHAEPTGRAQVTSAFNLPARYVLHTVGPIANGAPTDRHRRELASCYESCLDAAAAQGCESVVFCCVSTGVFGFPQKEAAAIAVETVRAWLDRHAGAAGNASGSAAVGAGGDASGSAAADAALGEMPRASGAAAPNASAPNAAAPNAAAPNAAAPNAAAPNAAAPNASAPMKVVFNVFSEADERIYHDLLG